MTIQELQERLLEYLNNNTTLSVRWDCGGDEALVYIFHDAKQISPDDVFVQEFSEFLITHLDLPSAGDFSLSGEAIISIKEAGIVITYATRYSGPIDYDAENEQEICVENQEGGGESLLSQL